MIILNGKEVIREKFPNNETKVKDDLCVKTQNIIELKYESDQDLLVLMFLKMELEKSPNLTNKLFIWYMPYSRMDRKIEGDLFTLEYICEFFVALNFNKIYVMEPHSEVTMRLLNACVSKYRVTTEVHDIYPACDWLEKIKQKVGFTSNDHIVFPDKGAAARYKDKGYLNLCVMEKKREPSTGNILDMTLKEGHVNPGAKCVIIDDLCSKGGTFGWAASILKNLGASEVYLLVTHCESNIFCGKLLDDNSPIDKVFTSTSMMRKPHEKIEYMDVNINEYIK